jgi:ubiquinone/menaquinone biosynthesis C-methylase UbiE
MSRDKRVFPHKFAFALLIPLRNVLLSPRRLIERLELKESSNALEVGPGPGYFSAKVASILTRGRLVIADIQPEMLDIAKKRLDKRGLSNVEYRQCDGRAFDLPDSSFDRIFLVAVMGEVENKESYMSEFRRMLKTGGILSISEIAGDPDKMPADSLRRLASGAGFNFYRFYGNKWSYTLNFRKGI